MTALTLTVTQAAEQLDVTEQWLRKEAAAGRIPSRKVGRSRRFTEADLTDYLERVRQGGDPWQQSAQSRSRRRRTA